MMARMTVSSRTGLLAGILVAGALFGMLAAVLAGAEVSSARVLAAVWLMALPLLGVAALAGWGAAMLVRAAVRASGRGG
jgi:hypothetical protein